MALVSLATLKLACMTVTCHGKIVANLFVTCHCKGVLCVVIIGLVRLD